MIVDIGGTLPCHQQRSRVFTRPASRLIEDARWGTAMPKSCCEVWWEIEDEFSQYRVKLPGLGYMRLPDKVVSAALDKLRQACRELNAPDLYGPDDSSLVNVADDPLFGRSWRSHRPFQAAGLRIPRFQKSCVWAAIERGEICEEWEESDPPRTPVNEVDSLLRYLQDEWKQNLQLCSTGKKWDEDVIKSMRQVFQRAWHASVWFYGQGKLSESPIDIREPKTMPEVREYLLRFDGWLRVARVEQLSPTSPSGLPPREIQTISSVATENVTTTTHGQVVSRTHWLHKAVEVPPSTHQFGALTGTRAELGFVFRDPENDGQCDTAQRELLAVKVDNGIVWLRKRAGEKTFDAFFRSKNELDGATKQLAAFRKRKKASANASKRKAAKASAS